MKKILALAAIVFLLFTMLTARFPPSAAAASTTWTPGAGCVGYWTFDEGSGTVAHDSSGNGNSGTLTNYQDTTLSQWVTGRYGSALKFDGVGNFVKVPDSSSLDFSSAVTVMAWVYLPAGAHLSNTKILVKNAVNGAANVDFGIQNDSGTLVVYMGQDEGTPYTIVYSVGHVPRNSWTNVAMTYNGTFIDIYINGTLDSSHYYTGGFSTNNGMPLCIGSANYQGAAGGTPYGFINGTIDDVIMYNRALTQSQIIPVMDHGSVVRSIALAPSTGFASTTIAGSGFSYNSRITITWDGTTIPSIPNAVTTDATGNFTALISVPTQSAPGAHTVNATDASGNWATATFTVVNVQQGSAGLSGNTQLALIAFPLAASIVALCIAVVALLRKKD